MTMSDEVVIKGYADLARDSKLRGDDPDAVGLELQDLGGDTDHLVAWLPGWLVDSSSSGSRKPTAGRKASTRISRTGSRAREELRGVLETRKIGARGRVWCRPMSTNAEDFRARFAQARARVGRRRRVGLNQHDHRPRPVVG